MKATVDATAFAKAVKTAAAMTFNNGNPVLSMVRITAEDDHLEIVGGNLEHYISTDVAADIHEPGAVLIAGGQAARTTPIFDGPLTIETEDERLHLSTADRDATLPLGPVNEYPKIHWPTDEPTELGDAWGHIGLISHAMGADATKPGLYCLRFEPEGRALATDSYRLAWCSIPEGLKAVVHRDAITAALKALKGPVSMAVTDRTATFTDKRTTILTSLVQSDDLNTTAFRELKPAQALTIQADDIVEAAADVATITSENAAEAIDLAITDGQLVVSRSVVDSGAVTATIPCDGELPDLKVNGKFLREAMATAPGCEVTIHADDPRKPVRITGGPVDLVLMTVVIR